MTNLWRCVRGWSLVCLYAGASLGVLGLTACSNGRGSLDDQDGGEQQAPPGKVTIGGTLAGLAGGAVVLQNNGGDNLTVSANGAFTFGSAIDAGSPYNITVLTQPASPTQSCSVANAAGTAQTTNVTSVAVTCGTGSFSVGGTVAGLVGSGLALQNNAGDDLPIASNGSFTFATALASGSAFEVTVASQPTRPSQTCTIADPSGTVGGVEVRTVRVNCSTNTYTIRGTVSGLMGAGLILQNNAADNVGVESDGGFAFPTKIPSGAGFSVTVLQQPAGPLQTCSVANGTGTVVAADVIDVVITCALRQFSVGGTVTNLQGSGLVLVNNGADDLPITANGAFTFPTGLLAGAAYDVEVKRLPLPPLQRCEVANGAGVMPESNVANITVTCSRFGLGVGGTVSGLEGAGLELQTNGEKLQIAANGKFVVPTSLPDGSPYNVTIVSQPANQVCTVSNARGAIEKTDATDVTVTCGPSTR